MFSPQVEKWRPIITAELARGRYPFPAELILSLIHAESRGNPGAVNPTSGASGLMQVMQIALDEYNKRTGANYTIEDLRGKTPQSIQAQIRAGLWTLGNYWKGAYKYLKGREAVVPVDDLATIADMFYAAGPGKIRPLLDDLPRAIFALFKTRYPTHKAQLHAARVWELATENKAPWNLEAIDQFVTGGEEGDQIIEKKNPRAGFILAVLLMAAAWLFFKQKKGAPNA